jgi:hypothetical protein
MARSIIDSPPATLMGPPNEAVFAYLRSLSAHSDIAAPLCAAVAPLKDVLLHCSDRERFGYVTASVAGKVFAFAAGMHGVALRLSPADAERARASGGEAVEGLGTEWVLLPLFGDGGFAGRLDSFVRLAHERAHTGLEQTSPPRNSLANEPLQLYVVAGIIFLFSCWGASFSHSCASDGCIGIVIPVGGALIALAAQILMLIPAYGVQRARAGQAVALRIGLWLAGSLAAFVLPMLFAKI